MAGFKTNPLPSPGIGRWSVDPDQLRNRRICREAIQQAPARSAFRWPEALKRVSCFIGLNVPCSLRMNRVDGLLCYATLAAKAREEWGTVDSSPKCNNASSRADMSCLVESHGKDGKQRTFPTFPRHGYGDLYDSIPDIRCTWTLYVPPGGQFSFCSLCDCIDS